MFTLFTDSDFSAAVCMPIYRFRLTRNMPMIVMHLQEVCLDFESKFLDIMDSLIRFFSCGVPPKKTCLSDMDGVADIGLHMIVSGYVPPTIRELSFTDILCPHVSTSA